MSLSDWSSLFQSHLYGIESHDTDRTFCIIHRFNRTFMELKDCCSNSAMRASLVSIAPLWNWKSIRKGLNNLDWCVSIAPLWNWKAIVRGENFRLSCFNRTFMELKVFFNLFVVNDLGFQSHLYGIESEGIHKLIGIGIVSIAPLWNWKKIRSLSMFE